MSTERDLLRDYAREIGDCARLVPNPEVAQGVHVVAAMRGEVAGKAFMALQNVLDFLDHADGMELTRVGIEGLRDAIRKGLT